MKINCLVTTSLEYEDSIAQSKSAHVVDPDETIRDLMDRLVGYNGPTYSNQTPRKYDPTTIVELRVCFETDSKPNAS